MKAYICTCGRAEEIDQTLTIAIYNILSKASLLPETSVTIFAAVKNETVAIG